MPLYEHDTGERVYLPPSMRKTHKPEFDRLAKDPKWTQIGEGPFPDEPEPEEHAEEEEPPKIELAATTEAPPEVEEPSDKPDGAAAAVAITINEPEAAAPTPKSGTEDRRRNKTAN